MHNPSRDPAGVGMSLDIKSDGAYISGDVFEPVAMRLVERKALRAFSVGISNARIVKDVRAPGGRIVGGQIVEVSLVDRPANPDCVFSLAKSVGDHSEMTGKLERIEGDIEMIVKSEAGNDDVITEDISDIVSRPVDDINAENDVTGDTNSETNEIDEEDLADVDQKERDEDNEVNQEDQDAELGKSDVSAVRESSGSGVPSEQLGTELGTPGATKEAESDQGTAHEAAKVQGGERADENLKSQGELSPSAGSQSVELRNAEPASDTLITPQSPETSAAIGASWAMRRLHDVTCPAYSLEAVKGAYATVEKDGLSSALGSPARGMLYTLLNQEVTEDGGSGSESDDIHDIAKAYDSLCDFLEGEDAEDGADGITTASFALAAREELRKGARIEDTADPTETVRTKSGKIFYESTDKGAQSLKTVHDFVAHRHPEVCTLEPAPAPTSDPAVMAEVTKAATDTVAEITQELTTKFENEKTELSKAHDAEIAKLQARIEELSSAPDFSKAPARAPKGTNLSKSMAFEEVQKGEQQAAIQERINWLRDLQQHGDPRHADAATEVLTRLGVDA